MDFRYAGDATESGALILAVIVVRMRGNGTTQGCKMGWRGLLFVPLTFLLILAGTLSVLLYVAFIIITHPFTALKKTRRDVPPACLLDPSLGSHEYVTANGIKFHCVSAGDRSKPLMLFLHGFPEFWFSWRYQMREFSRDYHVVAIDMRGFGDTDRPPQKLDYRADYIIQDIAELIPALGHTSCVLVGHNGGGFFGWSATQQHPELIDKFIAMNCPHLEIIGKHIRNNFEQLKKSWYVFLFQVPKVPELFLGLQDYKILGALYRGVNKASFPPDVVEAYKYTFSKPGALTAVLNYYRCFQANESVMKPFSGRKIDVPTLIIWGDDDNALTRELADQHTSICTNVTVRHIPNCSHWVQQDAPDLCNQYMRQFLTEEQQ